MTDKGWLLELADMLDSEADFFEEPEGVRWIQVSDKLAAQIAERLRAVAEKLGDDQVNARCVCPLCGQGHDPKLTGDSGEGKDD